MTGSFLSGIVIERGSIGNCTFLSISVLLNLRRVEDTARYVKSRGVAETDPFRVTSVPQSDPLPVSGPLSSNRTCGFPAYGSPTGR